MKKSLISLFVIFTFCFSVSLITTAYALKPYHVKNGTTRTYYVDNAISAAGVYSITVADNQWNGISNRNVYLSQSSTRTTQTKYVQDYKTEIFPYAAGSTAGYVAQTQTWYDLKTGLASESDCLINVSVPIGNDPVAPTSYSLRATVVHEMGHMIGLDHSDGTTNSSGITVTSTDDSIMFSCQPKGPMNYGLRFDDKEGYAHIPW